MKKGTFLLLKLYNHRRIIIINIRLSQKIRKAC